MMQWMHAVLQCSYVKSIGWPDWNPIALSDTSSVNIKLENDSTETYQLIESKFQTSSRGFSKGSCHEKELLTFLKGTIK